MFKISFFPKEDKFLKLLEELYTDVYCSAVHFKEFVEAGDEDQRRIAADKVMDARSRSKITSSTITAELCRSFITPFDREDVQDLGDILYKIPKIIEKAKDRLLMHEMTAESGDFLRQADLIVQEATVMKSLMEGLIRGKGGSEVIEKVTMLHDLEQKGDEVRNELILSLFKSDRDPKDIILRRDIYDMLEKVVDRFRDVAGVAMQIVLKHS